MRVEFVDSVHSVMSRDSKALFLTGDLGFNAFEGLMRDFHERFINAGAAEQNMVSVAAGQAMEGFRPWVYSIAPFVTYRCLEQIRNDVCLHNLPVHLAGNGGGYTYGIMGSSHHAMEDMAVLKSLPNMTLYFPCTSNHVASCVNQIGDLEGPSYLRLGFSGFGSNAEAVRENPKTLTRTYYEQGEVVIVGIGQATQIALYAIEKGVLAKDKISLYGLAKFPFDSAADRDLWEALSRAKRVVVLEEHYLYGSIAESLKMQLPAIADFRVMTPEYSLGQTYGKPTFQLTQAGLTPQRLAQIALN